MPIQSRQSGPVRAGELRCPVCGGAYPAPSRFCGLDGASLESVEPRWSRVACDAYAPTLRAVDLAQSHGAAHTRPPESTAPAAARGAVLLAGRYVKLRTLGDGSQGDVCLVHDIQTGRLLALKRFHRDMDAARCRAELEAATRIDDCSHIVKLYDLHRDPQTQTPFVTMEYLAGETLEDRLARGPELSVNEALAVLRQVSRGLATMHDKQLVHRDIKPANIMLLPGPQGYHVKLLDLGIAKSLAPGIKSLTQPGWVLGTCDYAAPEQLRGGPVTPAFDVYALGVVAHELFEGRMPGEPTTRERRLPRALRALIGHMLQDEPTGRPPSMRVIEDALAQIQADLHVCQRPLEVSSRDALSAPVRAREARLRVPKRAAFPRIVAAAASLAATVYCLFSLLLQAADDAPAPQAVDAVQLVTTQAAPDCVAEAGASC